MLLGFTKSVDTLGGLGVTLAGVQGQRPTVGELYRNYGTMEASRVYGACNVVEVRNSLT